MCLNAVLGSPKASTNNATQVIKNTVVTKIIFVLRIKGLIYLFSSSLKTRLLNDYLVNYYENITKNYYLPSNDTNVENVFSKYSVSR